MSSSEVYYSTEHTSAGVYGNQFKTDHFGQGSDYLLYSYKPMPIRSSDRVMLDRLCVVHEIWDTTMCEW